MREKKGRHLCQDFIDEFLIAFNPRLPSENRLLGGTANVIRTHGVVHLNYIVNRILDYFGQEVFVRRQLRRNPSVDFGCAVFIGTSETRNQNIARFPAVFSYNSRNHVPIMKNPTATGTGRDGAIALTVSCPVISIGKSTIRQNNHFKKTLTQKVPFREPL